MSFILHGMTAMQDKMSSFDTVKSLMQKQTLKGSQRTQTGSGYDHHWSTALAIYMLALLGPWLAGCQKYMV